MVEPLSRRLFETLTQLGICTAEQIHGCRGRVRRLTRDLPAFDTIWIDVLVQAGVLTRFQARTIERDGPAALILGPCILVDRLGESHLSETFAARPAQGGETLVVKRISPTPEDARGVWARLQETASRLTRCRSAAIVGPHRVLEYDTFLVAISRHVVGTSLSELQTRRGRFPPTVVWEMARQLAHALGELEAAESLHGDIRLANIRLTGDGEVLLVDCGIAAAVFPELSIHHRLVPERCDVMAPERIGTRLPTSTRSEIYAFGCLLWQLLAGRPPFSTADSLAKLAHHQTSPIPDIRKWVPDTPAVMAEAIAAMTAKEPARRPRSFRDLSTAMGTPSVAGKRLLRRFHREYVSDAPRTIVAGRQVDLTSGGRRRWLRSSAGTLALLGGISLLIPSSREAIHEAATPQLSRWEARLAPLVEFWQGDSQSRDEFEVLASNEHFLPLPSPDASGVIRLQPGKTYLPASRDFLMGPLSILGEVGARLEPRNVGEEQAKATPANAASSDGDRPRILVDDEFSLAFSAEAVTIENVRIEFRGKGAHRLDREGKSVGRREDRLQDLKTRNEKSTPALLQVRSHTLTLRNCEFVGRDGRLSRPAASLGSHAGGEGASPRAASEESFAGLRWNVLDPRDRSGRRIVVEGTLFFGCSTGVECQSPLRDLKMRNCLIAECGEMATFGPGSESRQELHVQLDRVTLRDCESAIAWRMAKPGQRFGRFLIEPRDCVFELKGEEAGFVRLEAVQLSQRDLQQLEVTGEGSLLSAAAAPVYWKNPQSGKGRGLSSEQLMFDGLARGTFRFRGPAARDTSNAAIVSFEGPRRGEALPGYLPPRLIPLIPSPAAFPTSPAPDAEPRPERRLAN